MNATKALLTYIFSMGKEMYNLHLIFTTHEEAGICNSKELLKIIRDINPDLIFEELEEAIHDRIYIENKQTSLETNAIKEYLNDHKILHIPVDTFKRPVKFHDDCDHMYNRILGRGGVEGFDYRKGIDSLISIKAQYGFQFLNSDYNDQLFKEIDRLKVNVLKSANDENLFHISDLERSVFEKREDVILDNIYNISKDHPYQRALLCMGSGHRNSMLKKIEQKNKESDLKLNWIFYNHGF